MNIPVKISDLSKVGRRVISHKFGHLVGANFEQLFACQAAQSIASTNLGRYRLHEDVLLFESEVGVAPFNDESESGDDYSVYPDGSLAHWYKGGGFNIWESARVFINEHADYFNYLRRSEPLAYKHVKYLSDFVTAEGF